MGQYRYQILHAIDNRKCYRYLRVASVVLMPAIQHPWRDHLGEEKETFILDAVLEDFFFSKKCNPFTSNLNQALVWIITTFWQKNVNIEKRSQTAQPHTYRIDLKDWYQTTLTSWKDSILDIVSENLTKAVFTNYCTLFSHYERQIRPLKNY